MGLFKYLAIYPLLFCAACSPNTSNVNAIPVSYAIPENIYKDRSLEHTDPRQAFYLFQKGRVEDALDLVIQMTSTDASFDYSTLRELCKLLILNSGKSKDPKQFLTALYGASLSGSGDFYPLLLKGLQSSHPSIQLASLQLYANFPEEHSKELLTDALGSRFLPIRMEAAYILASRKSPGATSQISSLMYKTPPELEPIFPQFFALIGDSESQAILRKLLSSPRKDTRVQTILAIGTYQRDDLLEELYPIATHTSPEEKEACSWAFGMFKDKRAQPILEKNLQSHHPFVKLAAAWGLYQMGDSSNLEMIKEIASKGNLFAISLLNETPSSIEFLMDLYDKGDEQIKFNAAISLLSLKNAYGLKTLEKLLISSPSGLGIQKIHSPSGAFNAWESVSSAEERWKRMPDMLAYSYHYQQELLTQSIDLDEKSFLSLAEKLFLEKENELIPTLINLLENRPSDEVIDLLKEGGKSYTSPLLRLYCYIALIHLNIADPYLEEIRSFALEYRNHPAIQFYTPTPSTYDSLSNAFTLTPKEKSQLLIDAYMTLANEQNQVDILTLLKALRYGDIKNRAVLSGIILKATE